MWRNLKANKGCFGPSKLLFADSETATVTLEKGPERSYEVEQCWCLSGGRYRQRAIHCRLDKEGHDPLAFWDAVDAELDERELTWLIFHNWGFDCDALLFRQQLEAGRYLLSSRGENEFGEPDEFGRKRPFAGLWVDDAPPAIVSVLTRDGKRLQIVDSMNWLPVSLEKLATDSGMPFVDYPAKGAPRSEWLEKCRNDVRILERLMVATVNWIQENDMGNLRVTIAAQSLAFYRHRFMQHKIVLHDQDAVKRLERAGYYGGRVEIFYRGSVGPNNVAARLHGFRQDTNGPPIGPLYELDASSLYASVMRDGWFPRKLVEWWHEESSEPRPEIKLGNNCIADVLLDSKASAFPQRGEHGTVWALGKFRTTLAGAELHRALKMGVVKKCFGFARYELARLFLDWAEELWSRRIECEQADPPRLVEARLWKDLMTALHGKFAQRLPVWEMVPGVYAEQKWGEFPFSRCSAIGFPGVEGVPENASWDDSQECWRWKERRRSIGGQVYQEVEPEDAGHAFVSIAAFVAAAARERVREWMRIAGPGNTIAVHTDALICTLDGFINLMRAGEVRKRQLGKLRIKNDGETGDIIACGHYRIGEDWCRSGIAAKAKFGDDGRWHWESFEALSTAAMYAPGPGVLIVNRHCRPTMNYRKGRLIPETGWIEPHVYNAPEPEGGARVA